MIYKESSDKLKKTNAQLVEKLEKAYWVTWKTSNTRALIILIFF